MCGLWTKGRAKDNLALPFLFVRTACVSGLSGVDYS